MINILKDYLTLCKPKVILVMLVTAWVGMSLASRNWVSWHILVFASLGIAFVGSAAAVINHLVDRQIDAKMSRTQKRPLVKNTISIPAAIVFSLMLGVSGFLLLFFLINPITAFLTLATLVGYAVFYTLFLKNRTPQNIVIGGAAGAMPPLLGWTSVTGELSAFAWILVLIIFAWTPPHFWALAIYRRSDYQKANVPMLPITHGVEFTKLSIFLYTWLLFGISLLPFVIQMSGLFYLLAAIVLGLVFLYKTFILYRTNTGSVLSDKMAKQTFSFSIVYLLLLFSALLIDHVLMYNIF